VAGLCAQFKAFGTPEVLKTLAKCSKKVTDAVKLANGACKPTYVAKNYVKKPGETVTKRLNHPVTTTVEVECLKVTQEIGTADQTKYAAAFKAALGSHAGTGSTVKYTSCPVSTTTTKKGATTTTKKGATTTTKKGATTTTKKGATTTTKKGATTTTKKGATTTTKKGATTTTKKGCQIATWAIEYADNAKVKAAKVEVLKSTFLAAVNKVTATAKAVTAEAMKEKKEKTETKAEVFELTKVVATCALNTDKTACVSDYGCRFVPAKAAVTKEVPAEFTCAVAVTPGCTATGEKKTPVPSEVTEEEKTCKSTKPTAKGCEGLSANCKGTLTKPGTKTATKVEAKCIRRVCSEYVAYAGACGLNGCVHTAPKAAVGKPTLKCEADAKLTDATMKKKCNDATTDCGATDKGGAACCSSKQSNKDYKAPEPGKCTEKTSTTASTASTTAKKVTEATTKKATTDKLSAASNMVASVTTLIVAVAMMS